MSTIGHLVSVLLIVGGARWIVPPRYRLAARLMLALLFLAVPTVVFGGYRELTERRFARLAERGVHLGAIVGESIGEFWAEAIRDSIDDITPATSTTTTTTSAP